MAPRPVLSTLLIGAFLFLSLIAAQVLIFYAWPVVRRATGITLAREIVADADKIAELREDLSDIEVDRRKMIELAKVGNARSTILRREGLLAHAIGISRRYNDLAGGMEVEVLIAEHLPASITVSPVEGNLLELQPDYL